MRKQSHLKKGITTLFLLLIFFVIGFEIFLGQKTIEAPVNESIFNYDESDPYIDRPTREALSHVIENTDDQLDIITDANGFDNFEIGVDMAEQMLVSNPRNPLNMQFGVNNSTTGQNAYYTVNGHDWTQSNPAYHSSICCDPWSAWDSLGRLTYGSGVSGQYIYRSSNGGVSYGPAILSVSGNDRNTLAADQTNGPYSNYLYAAITPGNFSRSTNNGLNWTQTYTSSNTIPGTMIAVGPNGSTQGGCVIYVTNTGSTQNVTYTFHRSTNGGANFSVMSSLTVAGYVGTLNNAGRLVINNGRTRPYPMIAMDNSYGPNRGRLYLVYASNVPAGNGNRPNIILQYSTNQGSTWSSKITVNNDTTGHQWFPAIWCEKETGRLYIKWYDTRENPATYAVNVYATYTDDGGATFAANQKLTTQSWTYPNPSCAPNTNCYRGDYDGMTANPKAGFAVWYDGRLGTYKNVGSYFPDFGMLASPASQTVNQTNDSRNFTISIPAVKLYTDVTTFSATVTPATSTGSIEVEFLGGNTLSSYPDSKFMKVKTVGTVTPTGNYTITVTGQGSNGTPVHKRTVTLTVNTSVSAAPCDDFSGVKFPPASMFEEYSGTNYWLRSNVSAYGIGTGSAMFNFYNAGPGLPIVQSLVSNNFTAAAANTYLTFDEAYAPYSSPAFGPDTLLIEVSSNSGNSYTTIATLLGKYDGTGELNTAPPNASPFVPNNTQWRPKIYSLPVGTNKVRLKAKSGYGNNLYVDNLCVQVLATPVSNFLCDMPEGFYRPTPSPNVIQDTIRMYLKRTDYPNVTVDSSLMYILNFGCEYAVFPRALNGSYYLVFKHRNSIETWTNAGIPTYVRGTTFSYDLINNNIIVYGNNQALVDPGFGYFGNFGGDIDKNNFVDANDVLLVSNASNEFLTGYVQTDVTGDNIVELNDILLTYNNSTDFVQRQAPPGADFVADGPVPANSNNMISENALSREKYEAGIREQLKNPNQEIKQYVPNWNPLPSHEYLNKLTEARKMQSETQKVNKNRRGLGN